jgi:hypothetical protein
MAQAGCVGVFFGVETGSPRMQKVIDKELDIDEAKKAVRWCGKRSVRVTAATIVGFPEEEECDLHATLDFLFEAAAQKHVVPQISFLAPLAGTPVYAQYKDRLEFSGAQSTFSHQGFPQGPAEIGLIAVHPGIFQNFYAAPTRLPREFVQEAALFLTWALHRCHWLSIALARHLKGPLALCRKWTDFRPRVQSLSDYYSSPAFHYDMIHFASAHQARSLEVEVLAEVQRRLLESADADPDGIPDGHPIQVDAIPSLAPGTAVFTVAADPYAVIDSLAAGVFGDHLTQPVTLACGRTPAGSQLYRLTPALARLLSLCDGKRDAESIAQTASLEFRKPVEALDAPTGWLVVLEKARQCGLVRFQAGVAQKRKPRKLAQAGRAARTADYQSR